MSRKVGDSNAVADASKARRNSAPAGATRPGYVSPKLTCYGNVRDLTAAPSPGSFESGRGAGFKGV